MKFESPSWLTAAGRIANGVMNAINKYNAQKAQDDVPDTLSNGGDVVHSDKLFTDLPDQSKGDGKE